MPDHCTPMLRITNSGWDRILIVLEGFSGPPDVEVDDTQPDENLRHFWCRLAARTLGPVMAQCGIRST